MRDNDAFRLIDPEEAVLIGSFMLGLVAIAFVVEEKPAKPERPKEPIKCEITIAQYGAGERWVPQPKQPACAQAAIEVPHHILSSPIAEGR